MQLCKLVYTCGNLLAMAGWCSAIWATDVTVEKSERGAVVKIGSHLFTEYLTRSGHKPVLWPLIGPTGKAMTRAYPLDETQPNEAHDHIHQRSFWFTHGSVNGIDFWSEQPGAGIIEHREFVKLDGGQVGVIISRNDWLGPDGMKILEDARTLTFAANDSGRIIDFDIELKASEGPVKFGDTKEGAFGLRVAEALAFERKPGGRIINSEGLADTAAWGQRAKWVDYNGRIEGEQVGIAILNHPASFAYPTRWHVRPYGLFAANPFGAKELGAAEVGGYTLPAQDTLKLHYEVLLHTGDEKTALIDLHFDAYSKLKK